MIKFMSFHTEPRAKSSPCLARLGNAGALMLLTAAEAYAAADDGSSGRLAGSVFSIYGIILILGVGLAGWLIFRKVRSSQTIVFPERRSKPRENYLAPPRPRPANIQSFGELNLTGRESAPLVQPERPVMHETDRTAFGAYRIDQEIVKLVQGKTHRVEVMSSRFQEDRRAIEASLVKVVTSADGGEDGRDRARQALEEYGFVARQSATVLMGRDAWERSSAARTLGQIGSKASLPFLIEALHDTDSVVRNQAVESLGALRDPAAIGALLDLARNHSDIPALLLSETLSACSVDNLGFLDLPSSEAGLLNQGGTVEEPRPADSFVVFEDLPDGNGDETLLSLLTQLENSDERTRLETVQHLGSYKVQRSVSALSAMALHDPDSAVRSGAVASLGAIDHPSVFALVLIALGDESREVRAAAARALTSLHFDRADAYNRVIETASAEILKAVASSCVKAGIAAQAIHRLTSEDRRQAYEAFSLMTLLAKADETQPILDVIENFGDNEIRLCAVRVLNVAGQADVAPKLRELVASDRMPEELRTAVLEVLYKFDQQQPVFEQVASE
jgi:HEAT repeat protein